MSNSRLTWPCLLAVFLLVFWCGPAAAQSLCVGDCDDTDAVTIENILAMVNITLDAAPLSACEAGDANRDSRITVDEILVAVNNALRACRFDVSGTWREDQYLLVSSDCHPEVTNALVEAVTQPPLCDYQLVQNGSTVNGMDCSGTSAVGSVDDRGTLRFDLPPEQETEDGCTATLSVCAVIPANHSPTFATLTFPITFSGRCGGLSDCTIVLQSRWTKLH